MKHLYNNVKSSVFALLCFLPVIAGAQLNVISAEGALDITVECGTDLEDYSVTGIPEISFDSEINGEVIFSKSDVYLSQGDCGALISRTWSITYNGDTQSFGQVITVEDTQGPVISGVQSPINVQCLDDVPALNEVTAFDACSGEAEAEVFTSQSGEPIAECDLFTANGPGSDWAVWLPVLSAGGITSGANFVFDANGGHFDQFLDGTAHLHGTVVNTGNANEQFIVDLWFDNKADWTQWAGLGRNYKNDLGLACATLEHINWSYYELVGGFSTMTGAGDLAGDVLYIYHMPADFYFGFQIGTGANNRNCNYGMSGWFTYDGIVDGESVAGHGDVNVDADCETLELDDCIHNTSFTNFFRAEDDCGHVTLVAQSIVVNDTVAPVFINCPESLTIECNEEIPAVAVGVSAEDNCTGDVVINYLGEVPSLDECQTILTRTWEATDLCGNRSSCIQTITIVDTTAPEFSGLPESEITVECDNIPAASEVTAQDSCQGETFVQYYQEIEEGNCPGYYTIYRHWSTSDVCDNVSEFIQTIHVQDTTGPEFDPYEFYTQVECNEIPAVITAHDNCGSATVEVIAEEINSGGCMGVYHRIYLATDECGNTTEAEQYIAILDNTAPEIIGVPVETTMECNEVSMNENGFYFGNDGVYGADNCEMEVSIIYSEFVEETNDDCPYSYDIVRTWIATDYCENQSSASQIVHVVDTTAPELTIPASYNAECQDVLLFEDATAGDNCGDATITVQVDTLEGNCPNNFQIVRTFVAVDECGNSSDTQIQYITVSDLTGPDFGDNNPNEFTYDCNVEFIPVQPVATDLCSDMITYTFEDVDFWGNSCFSGFVRVWTATDECDNSSTFNQFITIQDTQAPIITGQPEIERPCDDYEGVFVSATDNCSSFVINYTDEHVSGSCAGNVVRHYTATDTCGNASSEFVQIIHLTDDIDPVILTETADFQVECNLEEYAVAAPSFDDNCDDDLEITSDFNSETIDCVTYETYSWTAVDHCGNETVSTTVVTIVDTTNPWFENFPADITVSCEDDMPSVVYPEVYDQCDEMPEVELAIDSIDGTCPQERFYYRTFRGYDDCGNQVVETQTIHVVDYTAPVFFADQPDEYAYECSEIVPVIEPGVSDNCGLVTLTHVDANPWADGCYSGFTRIWTATDECENSSSFYQYIFIQDTTAPVVNPFETEIVMPCDSVVNEVLISASDACNEVIIEYTDVYTSGSCAGIIIRTYTIHDNCGNYAEGLYQQFITLTDDTDPTIQNAPENITVECGDAIPAYTPMWEDNCDDELTLNAISSIAYDGCNQIISQVYSATDHCGNTTSVTRVITIVDTVDPYFTSTPADSYLDCNDEDVVAVATAGDVCDDLVEVTHSDVIIPGNCPATYTIERTYRATDDCGNEAIHVQYIYFTDSNAPVFNPNQNMNYTYECGSEAALIQPVATDDCSSIEYSHVDGDVWVDGCVSGFERTWTAEDACGNISLPFYQYIQFEDTTDPVLAGCPSDVVLACDQMIPDTASVTATDICEGDVDVMFEEYYFGDMPAQGSIADCDLITPARPASNPCVYPYDWAMAIFGLPSAHRWYYVSEGNLVQYPNGSVHVTATMNNVTNPSNGWLVDVWFEGGMDWSEWSSQSFPTSFKADCGGEGINHEEWLYFILQAGEGAELTGFGGYAGSSLNLVHAPANNYFGFQLGDGANNYNGAENGFGGWFGYAGTFRPSATAPLTSVSGAGDFAFELDCCPDYWIVRQWTATDCAGNSVTCSQTITFEGTTNEDVTPQSAEITDTEVSKDIANVSVAPNPATDNTLFTFKALNADRTTLEIFDMTGSKVADVFVGVVEAGIEYKVNYNVKSLATGVYMYRLTNGEDVKIDRLIINK